MPASARRPEPPLSHRDRRVGALNPDNVTLTKGSIMDTTKLDTPAVARWVATRLFWAALGAFVAVAFTLPWGSWPGTVLIAVAGLTWIGADYFHPDNYEDDTEAERGDR